MFQTLYQISMIDNKKKKKKKKLKKSLAERRRRKHDLMSDVKPKTLRVFILSEDWPAPVG